METWITNDNDPTKEFFCAVFATGFHGTMIGGPWTIYRGQGNGSKEEKHIFKFERISLVRRKKMIKRLDHK